MKHDLTKCLEKVRKETMKANPGIKNLFFNLVNIGDISDKPGAPKKTGQEVVYTTETYKLGVKKVKTKKSFITHDFCPFCGKKYHN